MENREHQSLRGAIALGLAMIVGTAPGQILRQAQLPPTVEITTGTFQGQVRWRGPSVRPTVFEVRQDENTCAPSGKMERLLLDVTPEGQLAGVCVYLDQVNGGRRWTRTEVESEYLTLFEGCSLRPSMLIVPVGGNLTVRSQDDLWHLLQVPRGTMEPLELDLAIHGARRRARIGVKGPIRIECERHMWEFAYLFGAEHPYIAISDNGGTFQIRGVPAGTYQVRLWHPPVTYSPVRQHGRIVRYQPGPPIEARATVRKLAGVPLALQFDLPSGQSRPLPE